MVSNFDMNVFIPEVVVNLHPLALPMWILSTINTNGRTPFLLSDADVNERIHLIENVSEVEFQMCFLKYKSDVLGSVEHFGYFFY